MCDINESNPLLLGDLSINPQDLNYHNYNDSYDPDVNFINLRKHQGLCNYYNEEEFNTFSGNLFNEGYKNTFSTFHLNIRSLPKNYDLLVQYLSILNHAFSVLALSETWLNDDIASYHSIPLMQKK